MTIIERSIAHLSNQSEIYQSEVAARQLALWQDVVSKASRMMGKTFLQTSSVPGPPHTFVEEIDQIVQRRLRENGVGSRSVRILSSDDGQLQIIMDGKLYPNLAALNKGNIRNIITQAIEKWQNSN